MFWSRSTTVETVVTIQYKNIGGTENGGTEGTTQV
jgi:hypothetical protein